MQNEKLIRNWKNISERTKKHFKKDKNYFLFKIKIWIDKNEISENKQKRLLIYNYEKKTGKKRIHWKKFNKNIE